MTCRTGWRTRAVPGMAFGCVPSQHGWTRRRSDAVPATASEGAAGDSVPTTTAVGCVPGDGARGPSPHWLVQAMDARPAMAVGCLIRARWRSGRSNHRAESCADRQSNEPLVPAQRPAHQPPQARCTGSPQKPHDLARAAVGCMGGLGRSCHILYPGRDRLVWRGACCPGDTYHIVDAQPMLVVP